LDNNTADCLRA